MAALWLGSYVTMLVLILATQLFETTRVFALLPALAPTYCVLHFLRQKMTAKRKLIEEPSNFKLESVGCVKKFDTEA